MTNLFYLSIFLIILKALGGISAAWVIVLIPAFVFSAATLLIVSMGIVTVMLQQLKKSKE